ncbi:hypothetical protein PsorP6_019445 [Peronosclerospora sorghi]|nr:hypothetical protein PsorP6_019445 [Peronosclerospora sorghi]
MSSPHRYIPPIFLDLNMPAAPMKHAEAPFRCSSTHFMPGGSRSSRANSLVLDMVEFPLSTNSDVIKCEIDHMLHLNNGHDTPAGAQPQIFPLPNGTDELPTQDIIKTAHSQDTKALDVAPIFSAAVVTNTTISAARPTTPASAASTSHAIKKLTAQRGGTHRRERHNANERRRTNAAKDRIRQMRDMVVSLRRKRVDLTAERAKATTKEILPHRRPIKTVLSRACVDNELCHSIPGSATYLDLVDSIDKLRDEKRYLEEQLDQFDSVNSALQALQTDLVVDATASVTTGGAKKSLTRKRVEVNDTLGDAMDCKRNAFQSCEVHASSGGYCMGTEAIPSYLQVLFSEPMTTDAAFNWVKDCYGDIMALKSQQKPAGEDAYTVLGWREEKRAVTKCDGSNDQLTLELMLSQDFAGVMSSELVFNTWNLLTMLEAFQKLFPLTKDLAVLQTINNDCVILRIGIAAAGDAQIVHSVVVLARGQIDGGYLISMRSVPLSAGQKAFVAYEANYLPVLVWFMLLNRHDDYGQPMCHVVVGATTQHRSERALQQLATEFVAAAVRWQTVVGQRKHWIK